MQLESVTKIEDVWSVVKDTGAPYVVRVRNIFIALKVNKNTFAIFLLIIKIQSFNFTHDLECGMKCASGKCSKALGCTACEPGYWDKKCEKGLLHIYCIEGKNIILLHI